MDQDTLILIGAMIFGGVVGGAACLITDRLTRRADRRQTYERGYRAGQRFANDKQRQMRPPREGRIAQAQAQTPDDQRKTRVTRARITKPRRRGSNHS